MAKKLTEKESEFLDQAQKHRKEKVETLAYLALGLSLKANLPVFDLPYYVLQRARAIIEAAFAKTTFSNPEIKKARMEFMKVCLKQMRGNLEFAKVKEEKDETDARDNRCEPIVKEIVNMILSDELIFSDEKYFDLVLEDEERIPLEASIAGYENALDEMMTMVISQHWARASKELWGVEKEDVTFEMMDEVLKRNVETPKK